MIERLIAWSYRNRALVLLLVGTATVGGGLAMRAVPLDAIPDLTDPQVIIFTRWMKPPDVVENQVTYPIVTALLGAPRVKSVRAFSDMGFSYVYVIFEEGTDLYWARSRVVEYLQKISGTLPADAKVEIGPDATGIGWVFQYALVDRSGRNSLADLRAAQDWYLRYALQATPGVAEVAAVGGFARAYLVEVNPNALASYGVTLDGVVSAVRRSSNEVGGRLLEIAGAEFMVRGAGYVRSAADLEAAAVGTDGKGTPIRLSQVAKVTVGPDIRRGAADLDGQGEVVGGIVIMRLGENALRVIDRVKARLEEVRPVLERQGIHLVVTYDRSDLIRRAIRNLAGKLGEELAVVSLVCLVFLYHVRSAMVAIIMLPVAVILAFIPMWWLGVSSNIMSLGGIAIAIGAMVDAALIMIENGHKKLEHDPDPARRDQVLLHAAQEVGRPLFFTLLVITVAFLPIFSLEAQEGRLFKPLAYTKTFAMAFAALLSVTLVPVLMRTWIKGRIRPEAEQPINRALMRLYAPRVRWCLDHPRLMLGLAAALVLATIPVAFRLGSEFMPPMNEGTLLDMPTTMPGISVTEATRLLQTRDRLIASSPEVARVFGKVGRADTSTDPAPFSMVETTVLLKPEREWRPGMTWEKIVEDLDGRLRMPGVVNAWVMPIRNRIDMITTGIKTPVGVKVLGPDLKEIERIGLELERAVSAVPGARGVIAERVQGGYYLDIVPDREALARYGIGVGDLQMVIEAALGGETVAISLEGRERRPIQVRYARDYRDSPEAVARILVPVRAGARGADMGGDGAAAFVPLGRVARVETRAGPSMIRDEDGFLAGYVYVDVGGRDLGGFVKDAKRAASAVSLPPGYSLRWSGQYEFQERAQKRLALVVPATLFLVFLLLYFNTKSLAEAGIVLLAVPFSLVGAFWLLWILDYNLSVAVWVGLLALAGIDAETGVIMLLYQTLAHDRWSAEGRMKTLEDLKGAIMEGAVQRVRPKVMTVATLLVGLLPIMWGTGAGSDVMKRIAAPMVGGIITSEILEFMVYPVIFMLWKRKTVKEKEA